MARHMGLAVPAVPKDTVRFNAWLGCIGDLGQGLHGQVRRPGARNGWQIHLPEWNDAT